MLFGVWDGIVSCTASSLFFEEVEVIPSRCKCTKLLSNPVDRNWPQQFNNSRTYQRSMYGRIIPM
jgi:hypothetical protein